MQSTGRCYPRFQSTLSCACPQQGAILPMDRARGENAEMVGVPTSLDSKRNVDVI